MSFDKNRRSSGDDEGSRKRPYDHSHHSSYDRPHDDSSDDEGSIKRPPAKSTSSMKVGEPSTGLLIDRPTERDVLFGRGAPIIRWQGNVEFRAVVRQRKAEYLATRRHAHKDTIAREIIEEIETNRNGRFLKRASTADADCEEDFLTGIPRQWMLADEAMITEKVKQALRDRDVDSSTKKKSSSGKKRKAADEDDARVSSSGTAPMVLPSNNAPHAAERREEACYRSEASTSPAAILPMPQLLHQPDIQSQLLAELQRHIQAQTAIQQQQQQQQQQQPQQQQQQLSLADQIRTFQEQQGRSFGRADLSSELFPSPFATAALPAAPSFDPPTSSDTTLMYAELLRQQDLLQRLLMAVSDPSRVQHQQQQLQQQQQQQHLPSLSPPPPSVVINPMEAAAAWLRARQNAEALELQQQNMQRVMQETLRWLAPGAADAGSNASAAIPPAGEQRAGGYPAVPRPLAFSGNEEEKSQQRGQASPKQEENKEEQ